MFNTVESSAGALPVTRIDPAQDMIDEKWMKETGQGSTILEGGLFTSQNALYNPDAMEGMPVSVQIVGRKWEDEKVLAMMRVIDGALGKDRGFCPGSWDRHVEKKSA